MKQPEDFLYKIDAIFYIDDELRAAIIEAMKDYSEQFKHV